MPDARPPGPAPVGASGRTPADPARPHQPGLARPGHAEDGVGPVPAGQDLHNRSLLLAGQAEPGHHREAVDSRGCLAVGQDRSAGVYRSSATVRTLSSASRVSCVVCSGRSTSSRSSRHLVTAVVHGFGRPQNYGRVRIHESRQHQVTCQGQRRCTPGARSWSCHRCQRTSCTRRSGGTTGPA